MTIQTPISQDQQKILLRKQLPSEEDLRKASDELFMNLLMRVAELEEALVNENLH